MKLRERQVKECNLDSLNQCLSPVDAASNHMIEEQVLAASENEPGYLLELIAKHYPEEGRNSMFYLRISSPDRRGPQEIALKKEGFEAFGLMLLGLASFSDHNLYTNPGSVQEWKDCLRMYVNALAFNRASRLSNEEATRGMKWSDLGEIISKKLAGAGKEITGLPPF